MSDTLTPEERAYLIKHCKYNVRDLEAEAVDADIDAINLGSSDESLAAELRADAAHCRARARAHRKMVEMLKGGEG